MSAGELLIYCDGIHQPHGRIPLVVFIDNRRFTDDAWNQHVSLTQRLIGRGPSSEKPQAGIYMKGNSSRLVEHGRRDGRWRETRRARVEVSKRDGRRTFRLRCSKCGRTGQRPLTEQTVERLVDWCATRGEESMSLADVAAMLRSS